MRKVLAVAASALYLASCTGSPEGAESQTAEKQEVAAPAANANSYSIDAATSSVAWEGYGVGHNHNGTFKLNSGNLAIDNGNISSGNFEINIKSLDDADIKDGSKKDLIGHLLSKDFFNADSFATAKFEISKCEAIANNAEATHNISGNLTLKGNTKNVTFPAKVTVSDSLVTANAKFKIDRTQWGMSYGNDKSLKDKFISPEVGITLNISAKK